MINQSRMQFPCVGVAIKTPDVDAQSPEPSTIRRLYIYGTSEYTLAPTQAKQALKQDKYHA